MAPRSASLPRAVLALAGRLVGMLLAIGVVFSPAAAWAQEADSGDDEDALNPYRAGLVARFRGADGREFRTRVGQVAFDWRDRSPDRRLAAGPFSVRFHGRLQVQSPGTYTLRVFASGTVRLTVQGQPLLEGHNEQPAWLAAKPVELPFGYHEFSLEYERRDEPGKLALYWEGPNFQLEPVAGRWLHHDATEAPETAFERGAELVRALRCAACHDIAGEPRPLAAPALHTLAGNLSRDWLAEWLTAPPGEAAQGDPSNRRMPHLGFSAEQAGDAADYLLSISRPVANGRVERPARAEPKAPPKKKNQDPETPPPAPPSAAQGATLFRSLGCLACHRAGELGSDGLFGGGDLTRVAVKRPQDFFARWLSDPTAINRDHRMPVFALEGDEVASLSLYLQTLGAPAAESQPGSATSMERGRALVGSAGCTACHRLTADAPPDARPKLRELRVSPPANDDCLGAPSLERHRPGYHLTESDRRAVMTFLRELAPGHTAGAAPGGQQLLAERNCRSCHQRDDEAGLSSLLPAVAEAEPALRDVLPALAPPSLLSVGDKLRDEALLAAIQVSQPPRQTWLRVRMPRFPFAADEAQQIAAHLIEADRIPSLPVPKAELAPDTTALEAAGPRLVTADGFGCTSCHAIGKWQPQKLALNAQGADLSQLGSRVRKTWFDRWVRNPARIVPQMEMPSVQQPVRGVLSGHLDAQLAAVWQVLNRPGFTPPSPSALRVVRRANRPDVSEPAVVLTEVVDVGGKQFVKPLIVGLANRHNVLFDLATGRLAAWWLGDTARQQTRGKSWYWEAGMPQLVAVEKSVAPGEQSELRLLRDDQERPPIAEGDYLTEFDVVQHEPGGVRVDYRLRFPSAGSDVDTLRARQYFAALEAGEAGHGGFSRQLHLSDIADGAKFRWLVLAGKVQLDTAAKTAMHAGPGGQVRVTLRTPATARLIATDRGAEVELTGRGGEVACTLDYRSTVAADQFAPLPQPDRSVEQLTLDVVPGFDALRLSVTDQAMPTGLAWRPDGTLVVSSLEGRVWLGRDTNDDQLVDQLLPFSDELAAPFGVAASGQTVDVINKYGLLRLTDADHDGHAERMETLASGWGHTKDYHDWAVGLPRDSAGNYYISLPCQQDDRSEAGARLRGQAVRLVPRMPTPHDPRQFDVDPLCAGLRFPQGIALSPGDDLFVTDNQGNYTPFNELNHVVRGARYGFINRLESQRGFSAAFRLAAVEIPHPWTRSVNGICFLTGAQANDNPPASFGPYTGHLVGCEYDTRRLVRMSLERVGDDFQGAVYPMSREPKPGEATFEGPLVCQVSPTGDLYVGNIRDSGWGAGANTGSLVRLRWRNQLPAGIAEVRAAADGFTMLFAQPVDRQLAADAKNYSVASFRRVPTPNYGGPDQDRRVEQLRGLDLSADGRQLKLKLSELREGFVYEFQVRNLAGAGEFFPAEAYYTLRRRLP